MLMDCQARAAAARSLAGQGIWVTPTITVFLSARYQGMDWTAHQARPEMRYMNPETAEIWGGLLCLMR